MKTPILFFLCLFCFPAGSLDAQTVHKFPKGTYRTINQFLHDSVQPGTACDVFIKSESERYTEYIIYDAKSSKKIKTVFAYSDGDTIYLSQGMYRGTHYYTKSLELGRFLYFEDLYYRKGTVGGFAPAFGLSVMGVRLTFPVGTLMQTPANTIDFSGVQDGSVCGIILDTKSGMIIGITPANFKDVFASKPELVEKFNSSEQKLSDIRNCIRELNREY